MLAGRHGIRTVSRGVRSKVRGLLSCFCFSLHFLTGTSGPTLQDFLYFNFPHRRRQICLPQDIWQCLGTLPVVSTDIKGVAARLCDKYLHWLSYLFFETEPSTGPSEGKPEAGCRGAPRIQSTRVMRRGPGPARAEGGFCGLAKSLEPSSLEKDVGNLTAEAASFAARKWRRRGEPHKNSEVRKGFSRSSCGPPWRHHSRNICHVCLKDPLREASLSQLPTTPHLRLPLASFFQKKSSLCFLTGASNPALQDHQPLGHPVPPHHRGSQPWLPQQSRGKL